MSDVMLAAEALGRRIAPEPPRRPLPPSLRRLFRVRATGEADLDDEFDEVTEDDEPDEAPVDRLWAFRGVSFEVRAGSSLGVVGPAGCGKSTLARTLGGLLHPSEGRIISRGTIVALHDNNFRLLRPDRSLQSNGRFLVRFFGAQPDEADAALERAIEALELRARPLTQLGALGKLGGHQLGHALLLALEPEIVVVDELLAQGDERFTRWLATRVEDLLARGSAVVVTGAEAERLFVPPDATLMLLARGEPASRAHESASA